MKKLLPILPVLLLSANANAALLLTIDASTKTVSWSGSFTTAAIVSPGFDFPEFYLANTLTSNPNPSPLQTIASAAGSLSSVPTGFTGAAFQNLSPGQINMTESIGLISVWIANVIDFDAQNYTFTTSVADGSAISYSGINAASQTFLESLDGTTLDLVRRGDEAPTPTFIGIAGGGPAATITVVPEPSAILLGAIGSLALLRRRR